MSIELICDNGTIKVDKEQLMKISGYFKNFLTDFPNTERIELSENFNDSKMIKYMIDGCSPLNNYSSPKYYEYCDYYDHDIGDRKLYELPFKRTRQVQEIIECTIVQQRDNQIKVLIKPKYLHNYHISRLEIFISFIENSNIEQVSTPYMYCELSSGISETSITKSFDTDPNKYAMFYYHLIYTNEYYVSLIDIGKQYTLGTIDNEGYPFFSDMSIGLKIQSCNRNGSIIYNAIKYIKCFSTLKYK